MCAVGLEGTDSSSLIPKTIFTLFLNRVVSRLSCGAKLCCEGVAGEKMDSVEGEDVCCAGSILAFQA